MNNFVQRIGVAGGAIIVFSCGLIGLFFPELGKNIVMPLLLTLSGIFTAILLVLSIFFLIAWIYEGKELDRYEAALKKSKKKRGVKK